MFHPVSVGHFAKKLFADLHYFDITPSNLYLPLKQWHESAEKFMSLLCCGLTNDGPIAKTNSKIRYTRNARWQEQRILGHTFYPFIRIIFFL